MPITILDRNGNTVRTSQNLRAIIEELRVSSSPVKLVTMDRYNPSLSHPKGYNGRLTIEWENGNHVTTDFASFEVMREWVHNRPRNNKRAT